VRVASHHPRAEAEAEVTDGPLTSNPLQPDPAPESERSEAPRADRASGQPDVAQWKDSVRTTGLGAGIRLAPSEATVWPLVLHDLMGIVGPPRSLEASVEAIEEAEAP